MPGIEFGQPRPSTASPPIALSLRLRSFTRQAHLDAESAVDLGCRLASRSSYAALLWAFQAFFTVAETSLRAVTGWEMLDPILDIGDRRRAHLLDTDLNNLGISRVRNAKPAPKLLEPASLAQGLGVLYVLEGSALGGRVIATRARRALGAAIPVSFFTSAGRPDPRTTWTAVQRALDNFALTGTEQDSMQVLGAAEATFDSLADWLRPEALSV